MKKRHLVQRTASIGLVLAMGGLAAACGDEPGGDGESDGLGGESTGGRSSGGESSDGSDGETGGKPGTGGTAGTGGKAGSGGMPSAGGREAFGGEAGASGGGEASGGSDVGGTGGAGEELDPVVELFAQKVGIAEDLQAVSVTDAGLVYVAGSRSENVGTDEAPILDPVIVVARFTSDGTLDTTFGTAGLATLNIIAAADDDTTETTPGDEAASGVVALPDDGVAVVLNANDGALGGDVFVARFDAAGHLVAGFGQGGVVEVPLTDWTLGQAYIDAGGTSPPSDSSYDIRLDARESEPKLLVFGSAPALMATGRVDSDRYVARLHLDDGSIDSSFANEGIYSIDFGNRHYNDGARRGTVLADGSILSFGYTVLAEARHHLFILKLDANGVPDQNFGFRADETTCGDAQAGVICSNPNLSVGGFAEVYSAGVQADGSIVTTGYGRADDQSLPPDLVSFRFTATGMDATYGISGGLIIDSGDEDRGRDVVVLADDRVLHAGKYGSVAGVYVTEPDGPLWGSFGDGGIRTYPWHDGNFRGVATNGRIVAAVADGGSGTEAFLAVFQIGR